jgi:transposase
MASIELLSYSRSRIKKTLQHPKADVKARTEFQERIEQLEQTGRPIVYLDESGFAVDMPRTHGYSLQGKRCMSFRDWHAKGRINAIGALLGKALLTVSLFTCNVDSAVFHEWVTHDLLMHVPAHSVIVMDNATFHKRLDTKDAIVNAGHLLEFLPAYSPDLNPIEHKWAQAKKIRRKLRCGVHELFSLNIA